MTTPNEELQALLSEVAAHFTRDDDLPNDLLPRIDAALARQEEGREAGVERGLPTDRRMKAVELLLSQGYRWSEGEWIAPASPQGVSDAYRELMEVRAGLCTLGVMGPGETAAEALQRYVTRCTAAGAAPEGWALVRREPTPETVEAICAASTSAQWPADYDRKACEIRREFARKAYAAMLAATPNPGAQHGQEGR